MASTSITAGQVSPTGSPQVPSNNQKYSVSQSSTGLVIGFNNSFKYQPIAIVTASSASAVSISTTCDQNSLQIAWTGTPEFFTFYVTDKGLGHQDG